MVFCPDYAGIPDTGKLVKQINAIPEIFPDRIFPSIHFIHGIGSSDLEDDLQSTGRTVKYHTGADRHQ